MLSLTPAALQACLGTGRPQQAGQPSPSASWPLYPADDLHLQKSVGDVRGASEEARVMRKPEQRPGEEQGRRPGWGDPRRPRSG